MNRQIKLVVAVNLCTFIMVMATSCIVQKAAMKEFVGTYIEVGDPNTQLILTVDRFSLVSPYENDLAVYTCCDTVATGTWVKEGGMLVFSTPQFFNSIQDVEVKELVVDKNDSLYFRIRNPIEDFYIKNPDAKREIEYRIVLFDKSGSYLDSWVNKYHSNQIGIPKVNGKIGSGFEVTAYVMSNYQGRNVGTKIIDTKKYLLKNSEANMFEVAVPSLTYEFITYRRLNRDFIKIVSSSKLEWDGKVYQKL
ncbi:MAG: hypothetical protein K2P88_06945 [Chitinophagaceae bacterium]|uniref:hypothetical protein n=1 Tax=unclassified Paraflavitalea TaxID=2798305 RepID=UPI003D347619|nr:hypothetical protein [Chitinophagaceae bacterium]